jgi:hypothetical protein
MTVLFSLSVPSTAEWFPLLWHSHDRLSLVFQLCLAVLMSMSDFNFAIWSLLYTLEITHGETCIDRKPIGFGPSNASTLNAGY